MRSNGHEVVAADGPEGAAYIRAERFDLILTDIRMPGIDGFEIIACARQHAPQTPVIAMSGNAEIPDAVKAMHAGARDFLIKPFDANALEEAVAAVLRPHRQPQDPTDPRDWRDRNAPWLLGADPAMLPVLALLSQVADTRCTVLITGESGTGKELAARSLHAGSSRSGKPFVAVNSAAIPPNLVESELFGHARGAFTGATASRLGKFGQANGGTIFLDEIAEMELAVQAKLLRLIQDGELSPVGEETPHKIDVRILAATNRNLEHEVAAGRFRADLFWRLNVIPVEMPSLRARTTDIVRLAEYFLTRANERHRRQVTGIDPQTMALMKGYSWPGNIRELENLIERLVIVKGSGVLMP
ncbi:MAG: sigma-54 dependent transcriptional regulator, partial [Verrucomicrobiota bacterium]